MTHFGIFAIDLLVSSSTMIIFAVSPKSKEKNDEIFFHYN